MQFTILLDDGTKIKGRKFDKIEAAPSIAEEIVYTNNNFFHKDRLVVGLYIEEINKFFKRILHYVKIFLVIFLKNINIELKKH